MEFVLAEQEIVDMVAKIENIIQNKRYLKEKLILVCSEEHKSDAESMVEIEIQTIKKKELTDKKAHPLAVFQIGNVDMDIYDDLIRRGGYILLAKKESK